MASRPAGHGGRTSANFSRIAAALMKRRRSGTTWKGWPARARLRLLGAVGRARRTSRPRRVPRTVKLRCSICIWMT